MWVMMLIVLLVAILAFQLKRYWTDEAATSWNAQELMRSFGAEHSGARKSVLFVFAHPDDEAMFWTPTLKALTAHPSRYIVDFLCLSNGNFAGLGTTRTRELEASGRYFEVRHVTIADPTDTIFKDGMKTSWAAADVADAVETEFKKYGAYDILITFDVHGVSSHPNHVSTYHGVRHAVRHRMEFLASTKCFQLDTWPIFFKYSGPLTLLKLLSSDPDRRQNRKPRITFVTRPSDVGGSLEAMKLHRSQLVWFRYIFVWLASYTYRNDLSPIVV